MSQTRSLAAILAADVAGHDLLLATTPVDERDGPPFRNAYCARGARLSLPRKLKASIMAKTPRESGECRLKARMIKHGVSLPPL